MTSGRGIRYAAVLASLLAACGGEVGQEPHQDAEHTRQQAQAVSTALTFGPVADGMVRRATPDQGFWSEPTLVADASPYEEESYLRFSVSGVAGTVKAAKLRLHVSNGSADGPALYATGAGWNEMGLTWNSRPAKMGGVLGDLGAITAGTWVEYDVSAVVKGNGEFSFGLVPTSGDGADFHSKESGSPALRPQLVLTVEDAAPPSAQCKPVTAVVEDVRDVFMDTYVSRDNPASTHGGEPVLLTDGSPRLETYLWMDLQSYYVDQGWTLRSAKLRLYASNGSSDGPALHHTERTWLYGDLTWDKRPALIPGGPVADVGAVTTGSWVEYDVTSLARLGGSQPAALIPSSTNGVDFHSAESTNASLRPRVVITVERTDCTYQGNGGGLAAWLKTAGGDGPDVLQAMAQDAEGGFVAAHGPSRWLWSSPQGAGLTLTRFGADGTPRWSRTYAPGQRIVAAAVTLTPVGNVLVAGNYTGTPDLGTGPLPTSSDMWGRRMFLAKFSPSGEPVWVRTFGAGFDYGEYGWEETPVDPLAITTDANGSLIVTGAFYAYADLGGGTLFAGSQSIDTLDNDEEPGMFLAKYDWEGNHVWSRAVKGGPYLVPTTGNSLATDALGNVYVGGQATHEADFGDGDTSARGGPFVARYTSAGELVWKRVLQNAWGSTNGVAVRPDGSVAFAGGFAGSFQFGGQTYTSAGDQYNPREDPTDAFLGTLSTTGSDGWLRRFGGEGYDAANALAVDGTGALTVAGTFSGEVDFGGGPVALFTSDRSTPSYVLRSGADGTHRWSRALPAGMDVGALAPAPDGRTLLGGTLRGPVTQDGQSATPRGESDAVFELLTP